MSRCPFCNPDPPSTPGDDKPRPGILHRAWRGTQWLVPTALLVLMPKCPICVMAYVALFTGVGISFTTAQRIRTLLLVFCWAALAYLAFKYWPRRRQPPDFTQQNQEYSSPLPAK